jgi:hypothetical protein
LIDNTFLSIADVAFASMQNSNGTGITLSFHAENIDADHRRLSEMGV